MASLVMGKVVLISDRLPLIDWFSGRPLIYVTIWKTCIYVLCSLVIRALERIVPSLLEGRGWAEVYPKLIEEGQGLTFWIAQGWLIVLFLVFVAYRELIRAVGEDKVRKLFFGG
jgi:hypothetical protein